MSTSGISHYQDWGSCTPNPIPPSAILFFAKIKLFLGGWFEHMGPFFNDFIGAIYSTPELTNIWYRNGCHFMWMSAYGTHYKVSMFTCIYFDTHIKKCAKMCILLNLSFSKLSTVSPGVSPKETIYKKNLVIFSVYYKLDDATCTDTYTKPQKIYPLFFINGAQDFKHTLFSKVATISPNIHLF